MYFILLNSDLGVRRLAGKPKKKCLQNFAKSRKKKNAKLIISQQLRITQTKSFMQKNIIVNYPTAKCPTAENRRTDIAYNCWGVWDTAHAGTSISDTHKN